MATPLDSIEEPTDGPIEHRYYGHGLYYVARDGQSSYNLLSDGITGITRPETDVLEALLKYVQDRLKNPWDTDGV